MGRWSKKDRVLLNRAAETLDLSQIGPEGVSCGEWLKIISSLALRGLDERAELFKIASERKFLEPFLNEALERSWTIRIQNSFKESGGGLIPYLQKKHLR